MGSIFTKIIQGEIPSVKLYEDQKCIVILDINPNHKGHSLVIPKEEYETVVECPKDVMQHLIVVAKKVATHTMKTLKCDGLNLVINNKPAAGQEIPHIHIHVIPRYSDDGYKHGYGHVKYEEGELEEYGKKLRIN